MSEKFMLILVFRTGTALRKLVPAIDAQGNHDPSGKKWMTPSNHELLGICPSDCSDHPARVAFALAANDAVGATNAYTSIIGSRRESTVVPNGSPTVFVGAQIEAMAQYFDSQILAVEFLEKELKFFSENDGFLGELLLKKEIVIETELI